MEKKEKWERGTEGKGKDLENQAVNPERLLKLFISKKMLTNMFVVVT